MKIKTSETTPIQINWLVAKCVGWEPGKYLMSPDIRKDVNGKVIGIMVPSNHEYIWFKPSTDWSQAGPIIDQEGITVSKTRHGFWEAYFRTHDERESYQTDPTPLIAAMRCYVEFKLGDVVEIPDELI